MAGNSNFFKMLAAKKGAKDSDNDGDTDATDPPGSPTYGKNSKADSSGSDAKAKAVALLRSKKKHGA